MAQGYIKYATSRRISSTFYYTGRFKSELSESNPEACPPVRQFVDLFPTDRNFRDILMILRRLACFGPNANTVENGLDRTKSISNAGHT